MKSSTGILLGMFAVMVQWANCDMALRFGEGSVYYRGGLVLIFALTILAFLKSKDE